MIPVAPTLALYPADAELARAEQEAGAAAEGTAAQCLARARLAWCLRQRDPDRALQLCEQVEAAPAPASVWLRMRLLRGERALLALDLPLASAMQGEALRGFEALGDELGCGDAHWLASGIAADGGDVHVLHDSLLAAIACAERGGDPARALYWQAVLGRADAFRDLAVAKRAWADRIPADTSALDPGTASVLEDLRGLLAGMSSEFLPAIRAMSRAFELSQQSGQLRRAIALASNLGRAYWGMSEFQLAMEWLQRGIELARQARWPASIALCLAQMGETLRRQGRIEEARKTLQECLQLLAQQPHSRTAALALNYLAHTEQDAGQSEAALQAFEALMQRALRADAKDLQIDAQLGLARTRLALGRPVEARRAAEAGLVLAEGQAEATIELLGVLGDIHLAEPARAAEALGYYRQALDCAAGVEAFVPAPKLLEATGRAHAALGDFEAAYRWAQRAAELRQQRFAAEAGQRTQAIDAHHQVERARLDGEHLRRLAESEAARFQALRGTHEVLLHLSEVGREITAELDADRVLAALERHVHALLLVDSMAVYVLDEGGEQLVCAFGMEAGEAFTDPPIALTDPHSYFAQSAREGRELVFDCAELQESAHQVPDTSRMNSVIFGPLRLADRVTGVMTVQAQQAQAYGERETLVFRSLCAYAAIALENARAYRRLGDLQRHLMAQEKLAALGAMVAGVAHELNTPIGNSLLLASTVLAGAREFEQKVAQQSLRRSDWQRFARQAIDGLEVIERSMESAASLVRSFKQVAIDRSSEMRRRFALAEVCEQCAQTLGLALRRTGLQLRVAVPAELQMDAYPGALGQVLLILINNAMSHAFDGRESGQIELAAQALGNDRVALWLADDGVGMSEAVLQRIFEPFFTTKFGQGGSGLGLSICHNIVETLLGGSIRVSSELGVGSRFTLELPLSAP